MRSSVPIPIKYIQPIDTVFVKMEDGTDFHWFNSRHVKNQPQDLQIEWIDGKPYKISTIGLGEESN